MGAGILNLVKRYTANIRQWFLEVWLIVPWQKALVIIFLAALASGCVSPASLTTASPKVVAVTVAPSPTPALMATATPAPPVTPGLSTISPSSAVPENEEWLQRTYTWDFKNVEWRLNANISETIYEFYRSKARGASQNYADFALSPEDRPFLDEITGQIKTNGHANGYTGLDDVMNVLTFVQSLKYEEDTGSDYTRYPLETLVDEKGDCKDKSILAAAMLHEMGYDVVLLKFTNHMALGIKGGGEMEGKCYEYGGSRYYYAETTSPSWNIGDIPGDLESQTPVILPMSKSPTVEGRLEVKPAGTSGHDSNYQVICNITNGGPGTASNLSAHVYALALDRGADKIWVPDRVISLGDYGEGHSGTIETTLTVYAGERTQIYCVITGDNVDTVELKTSAFYG